jgi:hypothetical protein
MLKQLLSFLNGMVLEKELVLSASLFTMLKNMNNKIADIILKAHDNKLDVGDNTYYDIHPDNLGRVTMLSARRADSLKLDDTGAFKTQNRSETGVGKLVSAVLLKYGYKNEGGTFKKVGEDDIAGRDIELFVNEFKAKQEAGSEDPDRGFKLVGGEDIRYWYLCDNYLKETGTLGNSCMSGDDCQEYFDIYCNEPNVKMLIYTAKDEDDEEKLMGRALVWYKLVAKPYNGEHRIITMMDEVYVCEPHIEDLFISYAAEQGWEFVDKMSDSPILTFKLAHDYSNSLTPYVDTLNEYDRVNGTLSNRSSSGSITLDSTDGNPICEYCHNQGERECPRCEGGCTEECEDCEGSGRSDCNTCDGEGKFDCNTCGTDYETYCEYCDGGEIDCNTCDGSGEDEDGDECYSCDGEGKEKCEDCDGEGSTKCEDCTEGYNECYNCDGDGDGECDDCRGSGETDCGHCYGNGTIDCYQC